MTDGRTDRRTTDKVIPMCPYALQETQKSQCTNFLNHPILLPAARDINQVLITLDELTTTVSLVTVP